VQIDLFLLFPKNIMGQDGKAEYPSCPPPTYYTSESVSYVSDFLFTGRAKCTKPTVKEELKAKILSCFESYSREERMELLIVKGQQYKLCVVVT